MLPRRNTSLNKYLLVAVGVILFSCTTSDAQDRDSLTLRQLEETDLIDFVARALRLKDAEKSRSKNKLILSVIPIAPASTGNGSVAVSAINASFHLGHQSNLSTVYFYPYTNLKGSYGVVMTPYLWFDKNRWNASGDFRSLHNDLYDYGLGSSSSKRNLTLINYAQFRTYFTAHRRIKNFFYLGGGYNLDSYYNVHQKDSLQGDGHFQKYPYGTGENSVSSGLTFNILRDNRPNSINPEGGFYSAVVFRVNTKWLGSTTPWNSLFAESRKYFSLTDLRHEVIAIRAMYWGTFGSVPYFNLPATAQEFKGRSGRGYSANRFRGKQMLYAEGEYRFDISEHGFLGGVMFANLQSFSEPTDNKFKRINPAAGFGLRLKFNRRSDTNVTLDFAWGQDGFNFYVNLGEFF
jgi:outer membrane protein assembly factor BamA